MKKTILVLTSLSTLLLAVPVLAAETTTTGKMTFKAGNTDGGEPNVPGGEGETVDPSVPGGSKTDGPLRLEFVPSFDFGEISISSETQNYNALWGKGSLGVAAPEDELVTVPMFAQVTDERGEAGSWKLNVHQSTVFSGTYKDKENQDKVSTLPNTRIYVTEQSLYNSNISDVTDLLSGVTMSDGVAEIPLATDGVAASLQLLAPKENKTTDGSKSSIVFSSPTVYSADEFFKGLQADGETALPATNAGIQLKTPGSDVKRAKIEYTANLVWTLEDTL